MIAERDENTCRKDFTPSEMVALAERLEELERPKAAERKADAGRSAAPGRPAERPAESAGSSKGENPDKAIAKMGVTERATAPSRISPAAGGDLELRKRRAGMGAVEVPRNQPSGLPYVCIRPLEVRDLPGYRGELLKFWPPKNGRSIRVAADHPVLKHYPDHFAKAGSTAAERAIRAGKKSRSRTRGARVAKSTPKPKATATARRSGTDNPAPWNLPDKPAPQIRRPRAVVGNDVFDLSTVRVSLDDPQLAARQLRDRAMRAIERAAFPHGRANPEQIRGHIAGLVADDDSGVLAKRMLVTGSPEFRDAFAWVVRGGTPTPHQYEMLRGIQLGEYAEGGLLVPYTFDPTIVPTSSGVINPLRSFSRLATCMTNEWRGVSSTGMSAGYANEGSEASDNSPEFAQPIMPMHKADAWAPAAYEFDQDYAALEPTIAALLQRTKDELEATKFLTGTGEDEPAGLLTGATELIETATKEAFAVGDLEALEDAVPDGFLANATFLGSRKTFKEVRGFERGGATPLWWKLPGSKPEINGLPAAELSTMDSTIEAGKKILILGDFSYFQIVDRIGMAIKLVPDVPGESSRPTGTMGVYTLWRNSSSVLTKAAFRVLEVKAS